MPGRVASRGAVPVPESPRPGRSAWSRARPNPAGISPDHSKFSWGREHKRGQLLACPISAGTAHPVVSKLHWVWRPFSALSGQEVHDLLSLRAAVFVVEQRCAYQDPDALDVRAQHCLARAGSELVAYLRSMPPEEGAACSSLGRIVVDPAFRGRNLGRELIRRGIAFNREQWPGRDIRIAAQAHLTALYESLGFVSENDLFLEDGIEHVHMHLPA